MSYSLLNFKVWSLLFVNSAPLFITLEEQAEQARNKRVVELFVEKSRA